MVRYRRNRIVGGTFFFTVTLRDRRDDALVRHVDALRASWLAARSRHPHEVIAVVVLPDHLHAVVRPLDDTNYSTLLQELKKGFTRRVCEGRRSSPWQPRFWEHTIRDTSDLQRHIDYLHLNPMKHGWVSRLCDWPYSSFHRYVQAGLLPPDWAGVVG